MKSLPRVHRRNPPRIVAAVIAFGATLSLTVGCTGGSGSDDSTELVVWTFLDPEGSSGREVVLGELIDSFEAENPGTSIEVQVQQWDTLSAQFLAADAAGTAPDVVWLINDQVGRAVEQGALADLNSLVFSDLTEEELQDLSSPYWDGMQTDSGEMYGVIHHRNYFGLMYRTDLADGSAIDAGGVDTWETLVETARGFTDSSTGTWGLGQAFSTSFADPQIFASRLLESQGSLFDEDGEPLWANEAGVEALEFQIGLIETDAVTPPDAVRLTIEDMYEGFAAGQFVIASSAAARVPTMQGQLGPENVGFVPYPSASGDGPGPGVLAGWSVGVWDGTSSPEAAAGFVAHISSKEADTLWLTKAQQVPLYASTAAENREFLARPENIFIDVVVESSEQAGWLPPADTALGAWREPLNGAVQDVLLEGLTPMEALQRAEDQVRSG